MSGETRPEHGIVAALPRRPSPVELLDRGRRIKAELRAWLADLERLPSPDITRTFCEHSPGVLLHLLREQLRSMLDER
jgi:hypothetical protein